MYGNFKKMTQFAAGIVDDLQDVIGPNGLRVAVMTFAAIPTRVLGYSARHDAAGVTEQILLDLEHEHRFVFSETNFDVALQAVRTEWAGNSTLTTAIDWARRPEYPAHVVVLTDGKGSPTDAGKPVSALARLQAELNHPAWKDPSVTRWAFDVRGSDDSSDHGTLNLLASEPSRQHRGEVSLSSRATFVSSLMADAELCETTTGTTTQTTMPYHSVRADVVFMLDASDSSGKSACSNGGGNSGSGWDRSRHIAANIVRTAGMNGNVVANAMQFAVVAYSGSGVVLFDFAELDHDAEAIATAIEAFTDPGIVKFGADQQPTLPASGFSTAEADLLLEERGYKIEAADCDAAVEIVHNDALQAYSRGTVAGSIECTIGGFLSVDADSCSTEIGVLSEAVDSMLEGTFADCVQTTPTTTVTSTASLTTSPAQTTSPTITATSRLWCCCSCWCCSWC